MSISVSKAPRMPAVRPTGRPVPSPATKAHQSPGAAERVSAATAGAVGAAGGAVAGVGLGACLGLLRIPVLAAIAIGGVLGAAAVGKGLHTLVGDVAGWRRAEREPSTAGAVGGALGLAVGAFAGYLGSVICLGAMASAVPTLGMPLLILGTFGPALAGAVGGAHLAERLVGK